MITRELPLTSLATWILSLRMASGKELSFEAGLQRSSRYLRDEALKNFDLQRSPDGVPWAPLKRPRNRPKDRRARKKHPDKKEKILVDTSILLNSTQGGAKYAENLGEMFLTQGTNVEYAKYHQFGTRKMVSRPFTGINEENADVICGFLADDVTNQLLERF